MTPSAATPEIEQAAKLSNLLPDAESIRLRPVPRNHERLDHDRRRQFLLYRDNDLLGFLTVGSNLSDLRKRSGAFYESYPTLGSRIIGYSNHDGLDFLLQDYFVGIPATDLLLSRSDSDSRRLLAGIERIDAEFAKALQDSSLEDARDELSRILIAVVELPYWSSPDKIFLQSVVAPYLEENLLRPPFQSRMTNGDFMARNIIVDEASNCRIVDYEFAQVTHFHDEDWLRLGYWDSLPQPIQNIANRHHSLGNPLQVFFALKQLIAEAQTNLPRKNQQDAIFWCQTIRRLVSHEGALDRLSYFWPQGEKIQSLSNLEARMYWLTDNGWSDGDSTRLQIRSGGRLSLRFVMPEGVAIHALRFDPMDAPGIATIHSLTVKAGQTPKRLVWTASNRTTRFQLRTAADAFWDPTENSDEITILSFGSDPQLFLADCGKPAGEPLLVEVEYSFSLDVADNRNLVQRALESKQRDLDTISKTLARHEARSEDLEKAVAAAVEPSISHLASEIKDLLNTARGRETRVRELEHDLNDAQRQVAVAKALQKHCEQEAALFRDFLNGHAQTIDRLELSLRAKEEENASLQQGLAASMETISQLRAAVTNEQSQRERIERSRIWRWTKWSR